MYDVAIIGAGIIGTTIARELTKYNLSVALIEKDSDVANGTTKANSAIVHAGFDPEPSSLKGRLNGEGNRIFRDLCRELDVPFHRIGSLVIAFCEDEMKTIEELYARGLENKIPGLRIINRQELHEMEPGLSDEAVGALYAATAAITDPYLLAIALAESAAINGADVMLDSAVTAIEKTCQGYSVKCGDQSIEAKCIINAAGLYADKVSELVNPPSFEIKLNRGEYYLLDKKTGHHARHVLFPCPTALGKGVLIAPTAHGNLIIGPNSEAADSPEALQTTANGLDFVRQNADGALLLLPHDTERGPGQSSPLGARPGHSHARGDELRGLPQAWAGPQTGARLSRRGRGDRAGHGRDPLVRRVPHRRRRFGQPHAPGRATGRARPRTQRPAPDPLQGALLHGLPLRSLAR